MKDLTGDKFHRWTVIGPYTETPNPRAHISRNVRRNDDAAPLKILCKHPPNQTWTAWVFGFENTGVDGRAFLRFHNFMCDENIAQSPLRYRKGLPYNV